MPAPWELVSLSIDFDVWTKHILFRLLIIDGSIVRSIFSNLMHNGPFDDKYVWTNSAN